ncbi:MAG TPA: hypothetical protein VJT72_11310 [Pseudonocardiaceae bacterium]|nr:hypothetical protein [Pseudonocardiaceae bacterium]
MAARGDGSAEPSPEVTQSSQASSSEAAPPVAQPLDVDVAPDTTATKQPGASTSADSALFEAAAALPKVLKIAGAVVAPTTLLTALLFYFGQMYANGSFEYFGVNFTVLDLTIQDYLIRSADGLIIPLIAIAGAILLALWIHQLLLRALPARIHRIALRVMMPCAAIAGVILVTLAIADVVGDAVFPAHPETRGLNFSVGVLLLAYAARLLRQLIADRQPEQVPRRPPGAVVVTEWGAIFILVSVGLFWAVGSYASLVGVGRAQQIEALLPSLPDVVAFSEKRLSLQAPGVREVTCQDPDAAYRFRYEGLKLVQQSGNQYLFLPAGWMHANGAAILIPRSETVRLEFSPVGQVRSATC